VTSGARRDPAFLERRRRLAFRSSAIALIVAIIAFPVGMNIGDDDTVAGMFIWAGIIGIVASPWIVRGWQSFMRRRMIAAAVEQRPDIRHIDGEHDRAGSAAALSSEGFELGAFRDSGLIEAFESGGVDHILTGDAQGVPFALAEIALHDAKGYRMFGGVLASFRLARPRPGLTIVARDRGLLGNLVASAGSRIERLPLEDPDFEGVFEVYGDDQVMGRVILTTTMLERLKALDELAHARGFACAFVGQHLLIAFNGMTWRCPAWRIAQPVESWLESYSKWLAGLVDLPREIVKTLDLMVPAEGEVPPVALRTPSSVPLGSGGGQVFSSSLWRFVGEGGMSLIYVASGSIFGGVALFGAWYGLTEGYSRPLFWYWWGMIAAGVAYGAYAISLGVRELAQLAWKWKSPLRTLNRPGR